MKSWRVILLAVVCVVFLLGAGKTTINWSSFVSAYRTKLVRVHGVEGSAYVVCIQATDRWGALSCNWDRFNQEYPEADRQIRTNILTRRAPCLPEGSGYDKDNVCCADPLCWH